MVDSHGKFIFFDNGFDTLKTAQFTSNLSHNVDYYSIPSFSIPYLAKTIDQRGSLIRKDKLKQMIET
jgi:hypothetical protein